MGTVTFDTLKFANTLKAAGVPDQQAEAEARALSEIMEVNLKELPDKGDLRNALEYLETKLEAKIDKLEAKVDKLETRVTGDSTTIKWMLGLLLGEVMALIFKTFFQG